MADYYRVLQVDPSADPEVITAAYRKIATKIHPDHNRTPDATARFQQLEKAYSVLRDPAKREAYDRERASRATQPPRAVRPTSPHPYFIPPMLDFGEVIVGEGKSLTLTLYNDGAP